MSTIVEHSFFIVINEEDQYFKGFNPELGKAEFTSNPHAAKFFTTKTEIKLRPNEMIVEAIVKISDTNTELSEPFRPRRPRPRTI